MASVAHPVVTLGIYCYFLTRAVDDMVNVLYSDCRVVLGRYDRLHLGEVTAVAGLPQHVKESRAKARKLAEGLSNGWRPSAVAVSIQLRPGENCYAHGPVQLYQYLEGDGTYVHKTRFGFSAVGVAMAASAAIGNSARKARAAREAAPRFRPVDEGTLFLTDMRFAIHGKMQWTDIWYEDIRMVNCDSATITIESSGIPAIKLEAPSIDYYYVLYHFVANHNIIEIPPDA